VLGPAFVPVREFERLRAGAREGDRFAKAALFADLCRVNALYMIQRAGSGHLGSSFSSLDVLSWLYLHELRLPRTAAEFAEGGHDVCFSSKGHDAPAFYAVLVAMGFLDERLMDSLRRLGGLPGHPDVGTPFVEANTGSLGMGLSKAQGMALAGRLQGRARRYYVLTGDGEWQEGQMWEAALAASNRGLSEITVVVDHNKIQSDIWLDAVCPLPDLEEKFRAFGWNVLRCDGHDFAAFSRALETAKKETGGPSVILADTVKGKGVSFAEGRALKVGERLYRYHSGALPPDEYARALAELRERVERAAAALGMEPVRFEERAAPPRPSAPKPLGLVDHYSRVLESWGEKEPKLVILDADLAKDCGLLGFEKRFPARFFECGIAEQHMVSVAGGLALRGFVPVVHSFASFLSARANEQIFANATEKTKIIYTATLAGLLPAAPGHSHQAVRDVSVLAAVPGLTLVQPSCAAALEDAFRWAVEDNLGATYLRLSHVAVEPAFTPPAEYRFRKGRGVSLRPGNDALIFAYGPVMLSEVWDAAVRLDASGVRAQVIDLPWLNAVDQEWLATTLAPYAHAFSVDDHAVAGGQGQMLAAEIAGLGLGTRLWRFGVEGIAQCGENREALKAHALDAESLADRILRALSGSPAMVPNS